MKSLKILYNGAAFCADCSQCPIVEYDEQEGTISLFDPGKSERGRFIMTVKEYNALLQNAKTVV